MQKRLWIRIAVSFLLFLTAGTIGLIIVLDAAFQRLSHSQFAALAQANADFIRVAHLQPTDRLAGYLSQMLGAEAQFRRAPAPDPHHEAVSVPLEPGVELTLIRERPTLRALLLRPVTLVALAAFWGLWFALAGAVVRPYLKARRLAFLGQMATGLAHQIRNPVSAIRLHAQLLQKTDSDTAALIVDEATAIEGMLNQWMFLARPEPPRKSDIAPGDLIAQTVRLLAPAASHARVQILVDADSGQRLPADARRLGQVFHNIILNAIQAMPGGGTLTITARDRSISFADTGAGFTKSALGRWAEMLYSEKEGGMGIGLSVAREIISAHGGRLTVANQSRGGAIVRIEL
jgi:signal transduction histidine kinase